MRKPRAARVDRASKEGCFYRLLPISGGREAHPWGSPAGPASGTGHGEPFSGSKSFTRTATCPCTAGPHKSPPSAGPEGGERGSTAHLPAVPIAFSWSWPRLLLVLATPIASSPAGGPRSLRRRLLVQAKSLPNGLLPVGCDSGGQRVAPAVPSSPTTDERLLWVVHRHENSCQFAMAEPQGPPPSARLPPAGLCALGSKGHIPPAVHCQGHSQVHLTAWGLAFKPLSSLPTGARDTASPVISLAGI